jgi:hypothetical protein
MDNWTYVTSMARQQTLRTELLYKPVAASRVTLDIPIFARNQLGPVTGQYTCDNSIHVVRERRGDIDTRQYGVEG